MVTVTQRLGLRTGGHGNSNTEMRVRNKKTWSQKHRDKG